MTSNDYAKLKNVRTNDYIKSIKKLGYDHTRTNGSHFIFTGNNLPMLSIPNHDKISPGVWRNLGKLLNLV